MAKTNYYLKSTPNGAGEQLIILSFSYSGSRLRYSMGQTIEENFWNKEVQCARKNYQGQSTLNNYLKRLSGYVNDIYRNALADGINP